MKTIGLLGGTSWPSTPLYYEYLNRGVSARMGGHHSAEIILYSIDYHDIKSLYEAPGGWEKIPVLLAEKLSRLSGMGPDCILICNNTLHKALPAVHPLLDKDAPVVVDLVAATGRGLEKRGAKKVLLLGTRFTMEDGFFAARLEQEHGLAVSVPDKPARDAIQKIQSAVAAGHQTRAHANDFTRIVRGADGESHDAIVLACTELPLLVRRNDFSVPVVSTIEAHCDEALAMVLADYAASPGMNPGASRKRTL